MRVQSHALYAVLTGGGAAFIAASASGPLLGGVLGAGLLALALGRVNRLVQAEVILARGGALSDALLEDRGLLARLVLNQ